MSSAVNIERNKPPVSLDTLEPESEIALGNSVQSLRELTLGILKQLEILEEACLAGGVRRQINLDEEVRRFETGIIRHTLIRTGGHQRRAARLLGLKVTTLNTKIKRYQIEVDKAINEQIDKEVASKLNVLKKV